MATVGHDYIQTLRRAGLRVTVPRLAVLMALEDCPPHADAETIASAVRARVGDIPAQTIYNVLRALVEVGLIRRIEPAGSPGLYELRVGDNHHHVVCRRCGATADITCAVGEPPCLEPSETNGFVIDEAEVTFWGLCPNCQSRSEAGPAVRTPAGA